MKKKAVALFLTAVLLLGCAIGGTVAWLMDATDAVANTFTVGNIDITLAETKSDFQMVPGRTIDKDPTVSVVEGSEGCYLFVKIEELSDLDTYIAYEIADGWTPLADESDVYYRAVSAADAAAGVSYPVLKDNAVTVKDTVTKEMMDVLAEDTTKLPELVFTAYAVQSENVADAAAAWALVSAD